MIHSARLSPHRFAFLLLASLSFGPIVLTAEPRPVRTYRVPMRDGVTLATDIYLPEPDAEDLPALLVRTPYGRTRYNREFGRMAQWGYAVAIQDTRGRHDSEGKAMGFQDDAWGERQDGHDTVEWLSKQEFTNGRVGTLGASAMGITQLLLAPTRPSGLRCQYILVAAPDLYSHSTYHGGALREKLVVDWLKANAHPDALRLVREHPRYDEHWRRFDVVRRAPEVRVPALHYGGWYDIFSQGTIDAFVAFQTRGGEGARGRQKLVLGPWAHGGPGKTEFGDFELLAISRKVPVDISARRWFDHHLKEVDNGADEIPPVTYFVMGPFDGSSSKGNVWRSAESWPPVEAKPTPWHLTPGGELSDSATPPRAVRRFSFEHDPADPVPTLGGANLFLDAGPKDQRAIEARDDVVVFTSAPLAGDLEVTGRVRAFVFASTEAEDTDIAVRLCDVYPDGRSILIADGIRRLSSLRPGDDDGSFRNPIEVEVDLWSTSIVFASGHRVRISVSSSNAPRFDVNPGTGKPGHSSGEQKRQRNRLHVGGECPSRIVLPIVADGR